MITLEAQARDASANLDTLRKEGKIPAVFYGKKTASTHITLARKDFIKVTNSSVFLYLLHSLSLISWRADSKRIICLLYSTNKNILSKWEVIVCAFFVR